MIQISKLVENLKNRGAVFPLEWRNALKYRGVGPFSMRLLLDQGFINPPVANGTELSTRAIGCLELFNINSKEEAKQRISEGTLGPNIPGCRNYGMKTHKEVCAWVGIPVPIKPKKTITCPHCGKQF